MMLRPSTSSLPKRRKASKTTITRDHVFAALKVTLVLGLIGVGVMFKINGGWSRLVARGQDETIRIAHDMGVAVSAVHISGVNMVDEQHLRSALGVNVGDPLFDVNIEALRARAEEVVWVKRATISRRLPDLIDIKIEEHIPFAHWQVDGTLWLVDAEGTPIVAGPHPDYLTLPFVVGSGAAREAKNLIAQLNREPDLRLRITSAIRVGDRRWDVRFDTGAVLSLPEDTDGYGLVDAWSKFATLQRDNNILSKAVERFDMRLEGRLVMKLNEGGRAVLAKFEQAT